MKKNKKEEVKEEQTEVLDKSVILPEEVVEVINGDEVALAEQMERTKEVNREQQLEALKNADKIKEQKKAEEEARLLEEKRIQEELKRKIEAAALKENELKAQEEANKLAEQKRLEEEKRIAELKKEEAAKIMAQQKVEEERRVAAEIIAQEENKKIVEQNKKEEVENIKNQQTKPENSDGPNNFKLVMAALLFIGLFVMVYFLPEISEYINKYQESRKPAKVITDGVSICTLSRTSENLDINTVAKFTIANSMLYKMEYVTTTVGDKVEDEKELNDIYVKCQTLENEVMKLKGISVGCNLNNGTNTTKQVFDFERLDLKSAKAAYTEAGGIFPEFKKNDNIDDIERKMKSSGYECTRN